MSWESQGRRASTKKRGRGSNQQNHLKVLSLSVCIPLLQLLASHQQRRPTDDQPATANQPPSNQPDRHVNRHSTGKGIAQFSIIIITLPTFFFLNFFFQSLIHQLKAAMSRIVRMQVTYWVYLGAARLSIYCPATEKTTS